MIGSLLKFIKNNKKLTAILAGAAVVVLNPVLNRVGLDSLSADQVQKLFEGALAYAAVQGVADHGKEAAKVRAEAEAKALIALANKPAAP